MSQPAFDFEADDDPFESDPFADEPLDDAANPTYSVCELADALNRALRVTFNEGVWVRGEIQGLQERNGHLYLTLADDTPGQKGVLRVQFFANARARIRPMLQQHRLRLADGMKVRIFGHLDFYGPSGSLGLKMVDLDPRFTLGDLDQQRREVLRRLAADGSLDANGRHRLSPVPLRIGVVSSAGTAAWHDFHDELERSGFGFRLLLADTRVQGPGAPGAVARAIATLSRQATSQRLDALVVIRGGGARNELSVFDAEPIARAIAAAPVPVLTGLGHETDRSVADECAHTSLKTPTACAQLLVRTVGTTLERAEARYTAIVAAGRAGVATADRGVLDRAHRIAVRTRGAVERADERLAVRIDRVRAGALRPLDSLERRLDRATARLIDRPPQVLAAEERHLEGLAARVRLLDPVNLLARGWTITRRADGTIVTNPDELVVGDVIATQFAAGAVTSRVEDPPRNDP